jgi:hypothetical protein
MKEEIKEEMSEEMFNALTEEDFQEVQDFANQQITNLSERLKEELTVDEMFTALSVVGASMGYFFYQAIESFRCGDLKLTDCQRDTLRYQVELFVEYLPMFKHDDSDLH